MTVVESLEKEGLGEGRPSLEDRRASEVDMTGKGGQRFKQVFPLPASYKSEIFSVLTVEEQQQLRD